MSLVESLTAVTPRGRALHAPAALVRTAAPAAVLAPGLLLATRIAWRVPGAAARVRPDGVLAVVPRDGGPARVQPAPLAWQRIGGVRTPVAVRWRVDREGPVGLALRPGARGAPPPI